MELAAQILQNLGFLLYGGPMVAFAVLLMAADHVPHMRPWDLVRAYRAWGAGFGLSLGACILGGLSLYWLRTGAFAWGWESSEDRSVLAAFLAFGALWVSNVKLEIWSLEPLRKLDRDGEVADPAAYRAALVRFNRHLAVHAALVLITAVLATRAGLS